MHLKSDNGIVFKTYVQGSYFGEVEILEGNLRDCTVQVTSQGANFLVLNKKDLLDVMEEFPDMAREIKEIARVRKLRNEAARNHVDNLLPSHRRSSLELHQAPIKLPEVQEPPKSKEPDIEILSPGRSRRMTGWNLLPNTLKENNRRIWEQAIKQDQEMRNESLWSAVTKAFKDTKLQDGETTPIVQRRAKNKIINSLANNLLKSEFGLSINSTPSTDTIDSNHLHHPDSADSDSKPQFMPHPKQFKIRIASLQDPDIVEAPLRALESMLEYSEDSDSFHSMMENPAGLLSDFGMLEDEVERCLDDGRQIMKHIESKQSSISNMLTDILQKLPRK